MDIIPHPDKPGTYILREEGSGVPVAVGRLIAEPVTVERGTRISGISFEVDSVVTSTATAPGAISSDAAGRATVIGPVGTGEEYPEVTR